MPALRCIILQHRLYFISLTTWLTIALVFISTGTKTDCFLRLNLFHDARVDSLFRLITFLGDGLFSVFIALLILVAWKNQRYALQVITAFLVSGILAQVLKNLIKAPRPKEIIDPSLVSHFSTVMRSAGWDSFPSGHTTSVFALATILILHINNARLALPILVLALLAGYSRVYLGSHFPADVIAGAILGTSISLIVYLIFQQLRKNRNAKTDDLYNSQLAGNQ